METLGEFLKHGRESAGLSIEDLAGRTRIRIENLESLEREDLESLPTDPYVRGFVKLVCRELGLEPSDGLLRYETLAQRSGPPDEMTWEEETRTETPGVLERALGDPDRVVRWAGRAGKWGGIGLAAALAVVLVVLAVRWIDPTAPRARGAVAFLPQAPADAPAPELVPAPEPVAAAATETDVAQTEAAPPEESEPAARETSPPPEESEPAARETSPPPEESAPAPRETAPPEPEESAPAVRPEIVASEAPAASPPAASPSGSAATPIPGDRLVLRMEASRPVGVTVLLDGVGQPRRASLAAGQSRTWKADRVFVVTVTDGGAVQLWLDGRSLGPAGPDGAPVRDLRVEP
jgi:cytoskeletal protein RodZ